MKKVLKSLSLSLIFCMFLFTSITAKADSIITVKEVTASTITINWTAKTGLTNGNVARYYLGIGTSEDSANTNCTNEVGSDVTSYTFENLSPGTSYSIVLKYAVKPTNSKVTTRADESISDYAKIAVTTTPNKPSNVRQTYYSVAYNKLIIEWDLEGQATGFEYKYEDADGDITQKATTSKKAEITTTYTDYAKFKVRSYIEVNGGKKYSEWTDTFTAFPQPVIKEADDGYAVTIKGGKMTVKWDKAPMATGYEVYVSAKRNGTYKKVKTIKNKNTTKATIKKFSGKKFSPKKDYFVYVVAYKKQSNSTSRTSSNYVVYYHKGDTYLTFRKSK